MEVLKECGIDLMVVSVYKLEDKKTAMRILNYAILSHFLSCFPCPAGGKC